MAAHRLGPTAAALVRPGLLLTLLLVGAAAKPACTTFASTAECVDSNRGNEAGDAVCFWCRRWNATHGNTCQATDPSGLSYKAIFRGCDEMTVTGNMHVQNSAPKFDGQHLRNTPPQAAYEVDRRRAAADVHPPYPEVPQSATKAPGYGVGFDQVPTRVQSSPYARLELADDIQPWLGVHLHA